MGVITKVKKHMASIADSTLVNFVSGMGTSKDKSSHDSFSFFMPKSVSELNTLYRTDSTARKIVNKPANDMFRKGFFFTGIEGDNLTKLKQELKRLKVNEHMRQAIKDARLYGKAYIMLSATNDSDLAEPFEITRGNQLSYITALAPDNLQPIDKIKIPASEAGGYFDKPLYYNLKTKDGGQGQPVHHSRIIEISAEGGDSILQTVDDEIKRFVGTSTNAYSLTHEAKIDIVQMPNLADQIDDDEGGMVKRFSLINMLKSNNSLMLLDKEEEYNSKAYNFSGLPELMQEFAVQVAGACEIPYSILFGRPQSGLNATGKDDINNYYDVVSTHQEWQLKPALETLLSHISNYMNGTEDIEIVFSPLQQLDEKTKSEVEKNNAERDKIYIEMGVLNEKQSALQLIEEGTYTVITDEDVEALDLGNDDDVNEAD